MRGARNSPPVPLSRVPGILKILLVEDDLQDEQLLTEAFLEIEENRLWCNWRTATILPFEQLAEAVECLSRDTFDVVLLNLSLPDGPALLETFFEIQAAARETPIVVLADEPDENLANRLLREGAQDVLVKPELECAPLARSVRYAIERQRRAGVVRANAFTDEFTGVLSREAFLRIASHYVQLHLQLVAASIELASSRDLTLLIDAAEALGSAFEAPCIIGRWDRERLGLITVSLAESEVEMMLARVGLIVSSVVRIEAGDNVEELFSSGLRPHVKTAMLAD
jgi:DNA-binding response OmpR family regulator